MKGDATAMRHIVDPRQTRLFDPYERMFSPAAYRRIREGWQGVFRHVILKTMPVDTIAGEFSEEMGCPTKELYSMAGLVFIKQFNDWTIEQAADAYMFHLDVQYALNLAPGQQSLSSRTVDRYLAIFREQGIAVQVFEQVTAALVEVLEQNVRTQRLDSTHVFSNMAVFGRTRLMGISVKRFLTQVRRHDTPAYEALPEEMRKRYKPAANRLFGDVAGESRKMLRSRIARDMLELIRRFEGTAHESRSTFMDMVRVFNEQCTVEEEKVTIKEKPGNRVMNNPSDPDATYDGFKGQGYQVQVAETCGDDVVRLITAVIPQTAADSDMDSLAPVMGNLAGAGLTPETLLADGGYGSDANVQECAKDGVELVSPVNKSRRNPEKLHVDDFEINPQTECVLRCPAGHAPIESIHHPSSGKTRTVFNGALCSGCPHRGKCPVKGNGSRRTFRHTAVQRRNAARFRHEMTDAFRTVYSKRAGIEGTFSRIKSCMGMRRLRVRGSSAVFMAIILKIAGWNILQAVKSKKMRSIIAAIIGNFLLIFPNKRIGAPLFKQKTHFSSQLVQTT
jgi:hypothetical protein